jgi:endoglucanase
MMHKSGYQRRIAKPLRPALWLAAITSVSVLAPPKAVSAVDRPFLTGVNLAGAGFGSERIVKGGGRGRHGIDYVYPVEPFAPGYTSPSYFVSNGMNAFRLSFLWERLQPKLGSPLDNGESARLVEATDQLLKLGAWVVIDLHNYARYEDTLIGSDAVKIADFADVWGRIAQLFKGKDRVLLGLMNEPHDMSTETWVSAANAAIGAIRAAGASNLILVPGNAWSSAAKWYDSSYGKPNAEALLDISDPLDKVVFEAHLYLDGNSSGTSDTCVSKTIGVERLQPFARWLGEHRKLGFIGEFGAGRSDVCLAALAAMSDSMHSRPDIYLGWTYWAAGPWWPNDYFTLIEPRSGDAPQMLALRPYLSTAAPSR